MRTFFLCAALLATLAANIEQALAQLPGDPVTYTNGGVVYTAIIDPDGDTVSPVAVITSAPLADLPTTTAPVVVTTTARAAVSNPMTSPVQLVGPDDFPKWPSRMLRFQSNQRRELLPLLHKRQGGAALGGGGGAVSSQTGLQTISGYNPPAVTQAPAPAAFSSGTILSASEIPGYEEPRNAGGTGTELSSDAGKLTIANVALASIVGAVVFALA